MKFISLFLLLLILACSSKKEQTNSGSIIPKPNHIEIKNGSLELGKEITLNFNDSKLESIAKQFKSEINKAISIRIENGDNAVLQLVLNKDKNNNESYFLQTTKKGVKISAGSEKGVFYGLQSLKQLLLFSVPDNGKYNLPILTIDDSPRFAWRGIMLDESRHFFGVEKVKQLLDLMAFHKLNIFHWHLTDDPGWRIEIKRYPKLARVGGLGDDLNPDTPAQYYTQNEIKEIVKYAAARFIEVIPEIDMPGHARAANRAYPEFSGGGSKSHPEFTFNPGKTETYTYLTNILKEISTLFPSKYIHLGGDEVHFGNESWNTNLDVQKLMKTKKLDNLVAVESYFVHRMSDSIKMLDKTVIGWDEIVDHKLPKENALVMWWRHDNPDKLKAALTRNYEVVLCPRIPLYFDFDQDKSHKWGRKWGSAFSPMELVYAFPPDTLPGLIQHINLVKGVQGNIWTEKIQDNKRLDFMVTPRLSALAESGWTSKENKNLTDFKRRLKPMLSYFSKQNIYFYNPFNPELSPEPVGIDKKKLK
ncbi:MAG: beta-N-acetylhexosaminidase [Draconibacterium sp.]|nr:beta-N-acetylhexosaminidase [Draconibacterium sp.]